MSTVQRLGALPHPAADGGGRDIVPVARGTGDGEALEEGRHQAVQLLVEEHPVVQCLLAIAGHHLGQRDLGQIQIRGLQGHRELTFVAPNAQPKLAQHLAAGDGGAGLGRLGRVLAGDDSRGAALIGGAEGQAVIDPEIDGAQLFSNGISCLAKLKDGNAFADDYDGEAKTEDISIDIVPRLCDRRICIFPEVRQEDDYLTITYDNNQEEITGLQNMGDDDCYVYLVARITNFVFYEFTPEANVTNTPELKLEPIPGQPGMFRTTIIPRELFSQIPPDQKIKDLVYRIVRPGFSYPGVPPQEIISILQCE